MLRRRGEARQLLDRFDHPAAGFEVGAARGALPEMRFEWRNAESDFAVEQRVDFVREEVAVCHKVSENSTEGGR